jgi:hypothetical protein
MWDAPTFVVRNGRRCARRRRAMALIGGLGPLIHSPLQVSGWHQWNAGNFMSPSRSQRPVSGLIVGGRRELDRLVECALINDADEHAVRPGVRCVPARRLDRWHAALPAVRASLRMSRVGMAGFVESRWRPIISRRRCLENAPAHLEAGVTRGVQSKCNESLRSRLSSKK